MDLMHVYIGAAAVLVFALVGLVLFVSSQQIKVANTGVGPYLKFIWANFLKPHDKKAGGQQDALESFYKTQVRSSDYELGYGLKLTMSGRNLRCHSSSSALWSRGHAWSCGRTDEVQGYQQGSQVWKGCLGGCEYWLAAFLS
jgi:hypothetical protein